jgi:hypothetical protein
MLATASYLIWNRWWTTVFGRAMTMLLGSLLLLLVRPELRYWGIYHEDVNKHDWTDWIQIALIAPVSISLLTFAWLITKQHRRQLRRVLRELRADRSEIPDPPSPEHQSSQTPSDRKTPGRSTSGPRPQAGSGDGETEVRSRAGTRP